jgi:hypothetical protein
VVVDFTATGSSDAVRAAAGIGEAMQSKLLESGEVRQLVSNAIDGLLRGAAGVDAAFPIRRVELSGETARLHTGCPRD